MTSASIVLLKNASLGSRKGENLISNNQCSIHMQHPSVYLQFSARMDFCRLYICIGGKHPTLNLSTIYTSRVCFDMQNRQIVDAAMRNLLALASCVMIEMASSRQVSC